MAGNKGGALYGHPGGGGGGFNQNYSQYNPPPQQQPQQSFQQPTGQPYYNPMMSMYGSSQNVMQPMPGYYNQYQFQGTNYPSQGAQYQPYQPAQTSQGQMAQSAGQSFMNSLGGMSGGNNQQSRMQMLQNQNQNTSNSRQIPSNNLTPSQRAALSQSKGTANSENQYHNSRGGSAGQFNAPLPTGNRNPGFNVAQTQTNSRPPFGGGYMGGFGVRMPILDAASAFDYTPQSQRTAYNYDAAPVMNNFGGYSMNSRFL